MYGIPDLSGAIFKAFMGTRLLHPDRAPSPTPTSPIINNTFLMCSFTGHSRTGRHRPLWVPLFSGAEPLHATMALLNAPHSPLLTDNQQPFQVLLKNAPQPFINALTKRKTVFGSPEIAGNLFITP